MTNACFDEWVGFVPLIGDVLDFMFKANLRNADLLEAYLVEKAQKTYQSDQLV
jgi:hypothetical protein